MKRIVIVGFPNVGKSTLFNRLVGDRKSLVHALPGMTRDVVSARCALEGRIFELVDTGGFFGVPEEPLSEQVRDKAWQAVQGADLVIFLLDAKREIASAEAELYLSLKRLGKPVLVVVNKVDSPVREDELGEFYRLGEPNLTPISAEHNRNLDALTEAIAAALPGEGQAAAAPEEPEPLRIAIVGRINVGKSSLVNRLAGEERLLVSEVPGTTRDSTDTLILRNRRPFLLVDTAGIRKFSGARDDREKAGILRAKANIRRAGVICLVMDAQEFPTRQDAHIAHLARDSGKPLILALNKWDLVDTAAVNERAVRNLVRDKLGFVDYAPLLFVSALTGQRVVKILDMAEEVDRAAQARIETPRLNKWLAGIVEAAVPRSRAGGRLRLKYITQKSVRPPTFLVFTSSGAPLQPAFERFLEERLRREFGFTGSPIRFQTRRG